jgi:hypothetical protein
MGGTGRGSAIHGKSLRGNLRIRSRCARSATEASACEKAEAILSESIGGVKAADLVIAHMSVRPQREHTCDAVLSLHRMCAPVNGWGR